MPYNKHKLKYQRSAKGKASTKRWIDSQPKGIYGIFHNDDCLYIGKSNQISNRFSKHISYLKNPNSAPKSKQPFYKHLQQYDYLEYRIIKETTDYSIEKDYISQYSPSWNNHHSSRR